MEKSAFHVNVDKSLNNLVERLLLLLEGGSNVGGVLAEHLAEHIRESGEVFAELEREFELSAGHDDIDDFRSRGFSGITALKRLVIICREYGLVGFRAERFEDDAGDILIRIGKGQRVG
jgi:hypothetical protein